MLMSTVKSRGECVGIWVGLGCLTAMAAMARGQTCQPCGSLNWAAPNANVISARTQYALQIPGTPLPRLVCRVELPTGTRFRTPAAVPISLLAADAAGRPGRTLATALATILPRRGIYQAAFGRPVQIPAGATTYVQISGTSGDIYLPVTPAGLPSVVYDGGPGRWRGPTTTAAWILRLVCTTTTSARGGNLTQLANGCPSSNGLVARAVSSRRPIAGAHYEELLFRAPTQRAVIWFVFGSRNPIDLSNFGAPGCVLQVPPILGVPRQTDPLGEAILTFMLRPDPSLIGRSVVSQWAIRDTPTNALGFVVSDAYRLTIGNY